MENWTEFSENPTLNTGHYMALIFDGTPEDYQMNVKFEGGLTETEWDFDDDDNEEARTRILFLDDPTEQTLTVTLYSSVLEEPIVKVFTFDVILKDPDIDFSIITVPGQQGATVLNQVVSSLQDTDVVIAPADGGDDNEFEVTGTIYYKQGFTDYSPELTEQEGNYLVLQIKTIDPDDADVTVFVNENGFTTEVENYESQYGYFVVRVTELTVQITIVLEKDGQSASFYYDPTGLTLNAE